MARSRPTVVLRLPWLYFLLFVFVSSCAAQSPPRFQCSSTSGCQALAGYVATTNDTTYDAIRSLFQVDSILALYGANGINATTPASTRVPANTTVRVPFPCACANGAGTSDRRPVYTVRNGDGLDMIAREVFQGLVTFQQIAAANGVANASLIRIGQRLWIPLPCSCDLADGADAVHLAHVVQSRSTVSGIAGEFGTTAATLLRLNNMSDPRSLLAGQVLDVPIRACSSSIRSDSLDSSLRVPDGSYALTAGNCVMCSCSSPINQSLFCEMTPDYVNVTHMLGCPRKVCIFAGREVPLGTHFFDGSCGIRRCDYTGYDSLIVSTIVVVNQSAFCEPPVSAAQSLRHASPQRWAQPLLVFFHAALLLFGFL